MKKIAYLVVVFFTAALFAACNSSGSGPSPRPTEVNRTVLFYLGCDNNFYDEVEEKIEMLRSSWDRSYAGHILVYGDSRGGEAKLVHIYNNDLGVNVAETVAEYGSEDSADPAVLTRLLNDVKAGWPSDNDNYGLVMLSHGNGWLPEGVEVDRPRSTSSEASISPLWVISDVTSSSQMNIPDMADAIPFKLDFVVFDACNMASAEVVYELKDKVDYIVASAAEVFAPGFVYTKMPKRMMTGVADLEGVARDFYEYYESRDTYDNATVSLIDTSKIGGVADVCEEVLSTGVDGQSLLSSVQSFGYGNYKLFIDLEDYVTAVDTSDDVAARLSSAIDDCVIYKANTDYYYSMYARPINTHSGLTIYVPQSSYTVMNTYYKTLKWYDKVTPYVP